MTTMEERTEQVLRELLAAVAADPVPLSMAASAAVERVRDHLAVLDIKRAEDARHDALYPECAKLAKVKDDSQAIGQFLDLGPWTLMEWKVWDEPYSDPCPACSHFSEEAKQRCADLQKCRRCKGEHVLTGTRHYETYVPVPGGIDRILARYFSIDLNKVDDEKRAMLAKIREGS